jgi:site-specific DNA recombinase
MMPTMRYGAYLRVSTDEQAERGTIETQRVELVAWAARRGIELEYFEDAGWSGTLALEHRPEAQRLLRALSAGELTGVVVWKLDRLDRDPAIRMPFIRMLQSRGLELKSATEEVDIATAAGELMSTVLAGVSRFERQMIVERSVAGSRRVAAADGRWLGGIVPLGYRKRVDATLEIDEAPMPGLGLSEADVVREIFRRCAEDGWSTLRIAAELQARHIPTAYVRDAREMLAGELLGTRATSAGKRRRATQGMWRPGAVLRILHNSIYRGEHLYGRRTSSKRAPVARAMPAIVSPALFERAQRRLRANDQWNNRGARRVYLLRGLLTCSCGHTLIGRAWKTASGDRQIYECMAHPDGERRIKIRAAQIEPLLWARVAGFFERPSETVATIVRGRAPAGRREDRAERELLEISRRIAELEAMEARLVDLYARSASITPATIDAKLLEARTELAVLGEQRALMRNERAHAAGQEAEARTVTKLLARLADRARGADEPTRQRVLRTLLARCDVARAPGDLLKVRAVFRFGPDDELPAATRTVRGSSPRRA